MAPIAPPYPPRHMPGMQFCALVSIVLAAVAAMFFWLQGGFGGGHGPYDQLIFALGLPGSFAATELPFEVMRGFSDFELVIVVPCLVNVLACVIPITLSDAAAALAQAMKAALASRR